MMADRVYVMDMSYDGNGYTSVHRTYEGARAKLVERCAAWGILDILEASESGEVGTSDTCVASGEEDDDLTYGISYLEVEE